MALKDFRTIDVDPQDEERITRLWMSFGWELKNNQRIKTSDVQKYTGQDSIGNSYYRTTKGEDWVKLTFERDPERKNYAELKALEEQYYAPWPTISAKAPDDMPVEPSNSWHDSAIKNESIFVTIGTISLILAILSFVFSIIPLGVILVVVCVVFYILGRDLSFSKQMKKEYPIRHKEWEEEFKAWKAAYEEYRTKLAAEKKALSEAKKKCADALEKARALV